MPDPWAIAGALAGAIGTLAMLWLKARIDNATSDAAKAETRARWEGRVIEQLASSQREQDRQGAMLARIEDRIRDIGNPSRKGVDGNG